LRGQQSQPGEWLEKNIQTRAKVGKDLDRKIITLDAQEELIKQVLAANPKTIVVLKSSFPMPSNWTQENLPAILHMASQQSGGRQCPGRCAVRGL